MASFFRTAVRGPSAGLFRAVARPQPVAARVSLFSTSSRFRSEHHEETFEEFTAR